MQRRLREGDRVFAEQFLQEGLVMRPEEYGDQKVPVLIYDDDIVVLANVEQCMLLEADDDGSRVWA